MAGAQAYPRIATELVHFPSDGASIRAFLARPAEARAGGGPGVVILHEWWGLNDHITDIAQRFAREGCVALAPDLYSRLGYTVAADAAEAARLMSAISSQLALRDLNAAVRALTGQPGVDPLRIGAVGFCMGGTLTLTLAMHNSDLKAAVPFYGKVPPADSLKYLLCPILYHYGAQDSWVTRQEVDQLREGLAKYGKPGEVVVYADAAHAFFNDTRPDVYRREEAADAWQRTLRFLATHLR